MKTMEGGRKPRYRGVDCSRLWMERPLIGYNLGPGGQAHDATLHSGGAPGQRYGPPPEWTQPEPSALRWRQQSCECPSCMGLPATEGPFLIASLTGHFRAVSSCHCIVRTVRIRLRFGLDEQCSAGGDG